ncbi:MAG: hypothetical protein R3299_00085, partial [Arenibacter sp.]|nr:hypothetical protein [Arenibacter sp.]
DYTDEDGVLTQLNLSALVDNLETVTTIVEKADGTFTFRDENGVDTVIDVTNMETLTTLALNADNINLDYTDEDGILTQLNLSALVDNLETVTSLIKNNDGTLTFNNESGISNNINLISGNANNDIVAGTDGGLYLNVASVTISETITNLVDNNDGTITYTNENGVDQTISKANIIDHSNGTYTFTNNDGSDVLINTNGVAISNVVAGNRIATITNAAGASTDINETTTALTDNGDGTFTYSSENGTITNFNSKISSVVDHTDGTYTITDDFGNAITIVGNTNTTNSTFAVNGVDLVLTDSDGNPVSVPLADIAAVTDTNTTNTGLSEDGTNLILTDSDGNTVSIPLANIDNNTTNSTFAVVGSDLVMTDSEGNSVSVPLADVAAITDTNTTSDRLEINGSNLELEDSDGNILTVSLAALAAATDTNTTNSTFAVVGTDLVMTDSEGNSVSVPLGDVAAITDTNTTNTGLSEDGTNLILTDSDGNTVSIPLANIDNNTTNSTFAVVGTDLVMTDSDSNTVAVALSDITPTMDQITITGAGTVSDPFKVEDLSIVTAKLGNDAVTNAKLADNAVSTSKIIDKAVSLSKLADGTLDGQVMQWDDALSSWTLVDLGSVTVTENDGVIGNEVVDATDSTLVRSGAGTTVDPYTLGVATGGITSNELADDSVTASKINSDVAGTGLVQNVTTGALEVDVSAITGDGNITSTDLTVTGDANALLGDVTLGIAAGAVTTAKLAADAVTNAKLADNAVQTENILSGGNDKVMVTDALGTVEWIDKSFLNTDNQDLANVLGEGSDANNIAITNLADPTDAQDAATKNYVDNAITTSAPTIVSADPNNDITSGTDGGAFYDDAALQSGIATNASDIATNTSNITTNASDIATNVADITALQSDKEDAANKSTDGTLSDGTDTKFPTELAVKTYVDNAITTSAPTIVSADADNDVTAGSDGGAFYDDAALQSGIASNSTNITNNTTDIATNATNISSNDADIADLQADKEDKSNKSDDTNLGTSSSLYPTQNAVKTYVDNISVNDADSIVGNEVTDAADGTLVRSGAGTTGSPYKLGVATGGITSTELATNAVTTEKLAADAVTNAQLADNAVQTENILNGTILTEDLASGGNDKVMVTDASGQVQWINKSILNTDNQSISSAVVIANESVNIAVERGGSTTIDIRDGDSDSTNELQDLNLAGNILTLTNPATVGNQINLSSYLDNTDNQNLSIAGDQLTIDRGNTITIPTADGTETIVTAGNEIGVTGTGSADNPYVISNTRPNIFYPPSIAIDASTTGTGRSLNLYTEYTDQYATPMVASGSGATAAPAAIPTYANTELYYYVTYYDDTVFANVQISDIGVMTYDVIATPADYNSIINVVFVVK